MNEPKRRGPKTKVEQKERKRREILTQLEDIALESAPDALRALADAASGKTISRERISAATYIINWVGGRPGEKEPPSDAGNEVKAILNELAAARERVVNSLPRRNENLVEANRLPSDSGAVADS